LLFLLYTTSWKAFGRLPFGKIFATHLAAIIFIYSFEPYEFDTGFFVQTVLVSCIIS